MGRSIETLTRRVADSARVLSMIVFFAGLLFIVTAHGQVVNVPPDAFPNPVEAGSELNLFEGAVVPLHFDSGLAAVNINGADIGHGLSVGGNGVINFNDGTAQGVSVGPRGSLNISGGTIGDDLRVSGRGGRVHVTGGVVGGRVTTSSNSVFTISGGAVGDDFTLSVGATLEIQGGHLGRGISTNGGQVILTGGTFGHRFSVRNARLNILGGDFVVNGEPLVGLPDSGASYTGEIGRLSGTLSDGTPFALNNRVDGFSNVTIRPSELPPIGASTIDALAQQVPSSVRVGQHLVVGPGAVVPRNFRAGHGSRVTVNGGVVGSDFQAIAADVVISGGEIGDDFSTFEGSHVEITGGTIGDRFHHYGASLTISGGTIGDEFLDRSNGTTRIIGSDFRLGGTRFDGDGPLGEVEPLSGVFADGSPFIIENPYGFLLSNVDVPDVQVNSIIVPGMPSPSGIRTGQSMTVNANGDVPKNFVGGWGSSIVINDGARVGEKLTVLGTEITINGGEIGGGFDVLPGSTLRIHGGVVESGFRFQEGSDIRIDGGSIGDANRYSGTALAGLSAGGQSGEVTLVGSDFHVDGVPIELGEVGGTYVITDSLGAPLFRDVLVTGTFADGTPFAFRNDFRATTLEKADVAPVGPSLVTLPEMATPSGVRRDQTLVVSDGGVLRSNFNAGIGSTVEIDSGATVGENFEAVGASVRITGGSFGDFFDAFTGSDVDISGGDFGENFSIYKGATVHLRGTEFYIDGEPIDGLRESGDSLVIDTRDVVLSGRFLDGNDFGFQLNSSSDFPSGLFGLPDNDFFHPDAVLRLTLLNETTTCDFDGDGVCGISDINLLLSGFGSDDLQFDMNGDRSVGADDIDSWLTVSGRKEIGRPFLAGDANLDGMVDAIDLNAVGRNWLQNSAIWSSGDFNGDQVVDAVDLNKVGRNWQREAVASAVPEPVGGLLVGMMLFLGIVRRKDSLSSRD